MGAFDGERLVAEFIAVGVGLFIAAAINVCVGVGVPDGAIVGVIVGIRVGLGVGVAVRSGVLVGVGVFPVTAPDPVAVVVVGRVVGT